MKRIISIILLVLFVSSCFTSCKKTEVNIPTEEQIKAICELTTVKAYYNNLAKSTKKKDGWFDKDRKFWIEYEGYADIGIDMNKVSMTISDNNVTISMPPAEILNIGIISDSLKKNNIIVSADGFLFHNDITADDTTKAVTKAQKEMEKEVKNNASLFTNAENKAKKLIENYIQKLGEMSGVKYNITWKAISNS